MIDSYIIYIISPFVFEGFPIHIDATSIGLPIVHFKRSQDVDVFLSLKVPLILTNSVSP